jgi:hypothetical protein
MKSLPQTPELLKVACRIIWFEDASSALNNPLRLMTYALRYATAEDMAVLLGYVGVDGLRDTLDNAAPGIVDPRSWAYWNLKAGRYPTPPLPQRSFGGN